MLELGEEKHQILKAVCSSQEKKKHPRWFAVNMDIKDEHLTYSRVANKQLIYQLLIVDESFIVDETQMWVLIINF